jgi:hypothetical protein
MSYCCRTKRKCRLSFPDTDGDGVLDKDDKCPEAAGPSIMDVLNNSGMMKLNEYGSTIFFYSGKASFKPKDLQG